MTEPKIEFWDCGEPDRLQYIDPDEAIEAELDQWGSLPEAHETIVVRAYARDIIDPKDAEQIAEDVLERATDYYEEKLDPDGSWQDPITPAMKQAARAFADTFVGEFKPWTCHAVRSETINALEWIRENRPDWIAEKEADKCSTGDGK